MSPCYLRMPMVVASNLRALATQLSQIGLEEIWSPYTPVLLRHALHGNDICIFFS